MYYFGRCLRGTAINWFDVNEPETIEEAKRAFIEHYWGEEQQARFREKIYSGIYNKDLILSMSEYVKFIEASEIHDTAHVRARDH